MDCKECLNYEDCEKATHIENYRLKGCRDYKGKGCTTMRGSETTDHKFTDDKTKLH